MKKKQKTLTKKDGPASLAVTSGSASVTSAEDLACFWETRAHHREGCGYSDSAYAFRCCADDLRRLMRPSTVSRQGTAAKQHRPPIDPDHYLTQPMDNQEAEHNREICALRAENEQLKIKLSRMCCDA